MYVSTTHDRERAAVILQRATSATSLSFTVPSDAYTLKGELRNISHEVVQTVFSHWIKSECGAQLRLKRLRFEALHFTSCAALVATILDLSQLREVVMSKCWDTQLLMESLSQAKPELSVLIDDRAASARPKFGMLQTLLISCRGLTTLRVTDKPWSDIHDDFGWPTLARHGGSLRTLFLDDFNSEMLPYVKDDPQDRSIPAFRAAMLKCSVLEQLAIRVPSLDEADDEEDGPNAFLVSSNRCKYSLPWLMDG